MESARFKAELKLCPRRQAHFSVSCEAATYKPAESSGKLKREPVPRV